MKKNAFGSRDNIMEENFEDEPEQNFENKRTGIKLSKNIKYLIYLSEHQEEN